MIRPAQLQLRLAVAVLISLLLAGCGSEPSTPTGPSDPIAAGSHSKTQQVFQVRGVIQEIKPGGKVVVIQHEAIPDYMEAMTMPFDVKNADELKGLVPNDEVSFRMTVTETEGWIDEIRKTGQVIVNPFPNAGGLRRVRDVDPITEGDRLPDYPFTNEVGRAVRLGDFKGQVVALNFFFTRCPYPTFCPRMARNFAATQDRLKTMANAPTNWHLLSITFDPEFDTPGILKPYAKRFGADPERWSLLTGAMIDIDSITEQFGMVFSRGPSGFSHNERTVVVDPHGRVQRIIVGNEWAMDDLVTEMLRAAKAAPAGGGP